MKNRAYAALFSLFLVTSFSSIKAEEVPLWSIFFNRVAELSELARLDKFAEWARDRAAEGVSRRVKSVWIPGVIVSAIYAAQSLYPNPEDQNKASAIIMAAFPVALFGLGDPSIQDPTPQSGPSPQSNSMSDSNNSSLPSEVAHIPTPSPSNPSN